MYVCICMQGLKNLKKVRPVGNRDKYLIKMLLYFMMTPWENPGHLPFHLQRIYRSYIKYTCKNKLTYIMNVMEQID